jgi:hypothetical protein
MLLQFKFVSYPYWICLTCVWGRRGPSMVPVVHDCKYVTITLGDNIVI